MITRPAGDEAFKRGNYRDAWTKYSESLDLVPNQQIAFKIYCNRAMAFVKANRFEEGLADAEKAIQLKSDFEKAFYWKAKALYGLRNFSDAALCVVDGMSDFEMLLDLVVSYSRSRAFLASPAVLAILRLQAQPG